MAYQFNVGALNVGEETTFGSEAAAYEYLEVNGRPTINNNSVYFENDVLKQGLIQWSSGVVGHKSESSAELAMYMHGYTSSAVASAPDSDDVHPDAKLLTYALGNRVVGGYSAVDDAVGVSTVSRIYVTDESSFVAGQGIMVGTEAAFILEVNEAGSYLELANDLAEVPADETAVYGSITVFPIDSYDGTNAPSTSLKWLGPKSDDVIKMLGCRPNSLKLQGNAKDFLTMDMGFAVADWERADSGGNPEAQSYDYPKRNEIIGGKLIVQSNDGVTLARTAVDCTNFEIDFGLDVQPVDNINASQGVSEWTKAGLKPVIKFNPLQTSENTTTGWELLYQSDVDVNVTFQVGTTAGRTISIHIPKAVLVEHPASEDRGGLLAKSLTFQPMSHDRDTGDEGDDYATNKVLKISFC